MPTRTLADALSQATPTQNGVMTAAQAAKLAGIAAEATKNRSDADTDSAMGAAITQHDQNGAAHADLRAILTDHAEGITANSQAITALDQQKIARPAGTPSAGQSLRVAADGTLEWYTPSAGQSGATTFTGLTDTPAEYTGAGGRFVAVRSDATGLEFVQAPSGGGSSAALLPLDVAPTNASQWNDEFNGATLDPKWTQASTARGHVATVGQSWLIIEPAESGSGSTGARLGCGIRQNAPSGSFTVSAKIVNGRYNTTNDARVGIFVASTSTSKAHVLGSVLGYNRTANATSLTYSESADWSAWDNGIDTTIQAGQPLWPMWYRIDWNASTATLSFYWSANGVVWALLASRTGQTQPDRIGLAIWAHNAGVVADHQLGCDWFRVTAS